MLLALLGCRGSVHAPIANRVPFDHHACPVGESLEALARRAWTVAVTKTKPACVAVHTDEPLWVVDGHVPDPDGLIYHVAVVTPDGRVLSHETALESPDTPIERTYRPIDLDLDGRDELLVEENWAHPCCGQRAEVSVASIVQGKLVERSQRLTYWSTTSFSPAADYHECNGSYRVVGASKLMLEVVGSANGTLFDCEPKSGRHLYHWTGDELVEALP